MTRLRRRIRELEERVAALETNTPTVSYDMPPRYEIDIDQRPLTVEHHIDTGGFSLPDGDDERGLGVYL